MLCTCYNSIYVYTTKTIILQQDLERFACRLTVLELWEQRMIKSLDVIIVLVSHWSDHKYKCIMYIMYNCQTTGEERAELSPLTKYVSGGLDVNLHVVVCVHTAKVDTEQTGVEPWGVAVTHIAHTCLGLWSDRNPLEIMFAPILYTCVAVAGQLVRLWPLSVDHNMSKVMCQGHKYNRR